MQNFEEIFFYVPVLEIFNFTEQYSWATFWPSLFPSMLHCSQSFLTYCTYPHVMFALVEIFKCLCKTCVWLKGSSYKNLTKSFMTLDFVANILILCKVEFLSNLEKNINQGSFIWNSIHHWKRNIADHIRLHY